MPSIDISTYCAECNNHLDSWVSGTTVNVSPCEHCKQQAYDDGHAEGKAEGEDS